jgi:hypothetical protein
MVDVLWRALSVGNEGVTHPTGAVGGCFEMDCRAAEGRGWQ